MTDYFTPSLIMALTDYIPVILFFVASIFLIRFTKRNANKIFYYLIILGSSLVFIGGFLKATWKLIYAISDTSYAWMSNVQFMLLAPGTLLIFISTLIMVLTQNPKKTLWNTSNAMSITPFFILLLFTLVISTAGYLISLIILAKRRSCGISISMYIIYFTIMLAMSGNASHADNETINWISQGLNTLGMSVLLIGHYELNKADLALKRQASTTAA